MKRDMYKLILNPYHFDDVFAFRVLFYSCSYMSTRYSFTEYINIEK